MNYATMLQNAISLKNLSLSKLCFQLARKDIWIDRAILSKIQNGKLPPAKDRVNIVLAEILEIDGTKLRLAAARETIDPGLFELIRNAG